MRTASTLVTLSLLGLHLPALGDDAGHSGSRRNEVFLFDRDGRREGSAKPNVTHILAAPSVRPKLEPEPAPLPPPLAHREPKGPKLPAPPPEMDLRAPHAWMVTGAVVVAASLVGGLASGIMLDEPQLAAISAGAGGTLGLGALAVGVIMQNGRYEEHGYPPARALPSGIELRVAMPLP